MMDVEELSAEVARLKAERADLDSAIYVVLHDLKAPLRAISNLAQWIEEDLAAPAPSEWPDHLKTLRQRALDMGLLLDGLVFRLGDRGKR
jgi:light-regulated signal transduction histidine kinase (bacteriophytochrome)